MFAASDPIQRLGVVEIHARAEHSRQDRSHSKSASDELSTDDSSGAVSPRRGQFAKRDRRFDVYVGV
jgi:hypothetical protein